MKNISANIPDIIYEAIDRRVKIGLYSDKNEVINVALEKMFAEDARDFLRKLTKRFDIKEADMLSELENVRNPK